MFLAQRKFLGFRSSNYFIQNNVLLYVARIPRLDLLRVEQAYPAKPPARYVKIDDFIMAHHTNQQRIKASEFVFKTLEWRDNICIRSAIEHNLIPDYQYNSDIRLVNGEMWTETDYALHKLVRTDLELLPYEEYPEFPYGITVLPPFRPWEQVPITPLRPANPKTRFPTMFVLNQLRKNKPILRAGND